MLYRGVDCEAPPQGKARLLSRTDTATRQENRIDPLYSSSLLGS
jgi:hypothetical protein